MYLYQQKRKDGDVYLSIKEKFHIPGKGAGEKTIESIGLLSELKKTMDGDPVSYYKKYAAELTEKKKSEKVITIQIDTSEKLTVGTNDTRNVGYGVLKAIYKELELDRFWNWKTRERKMEFSTDRIFRLLTFARAMNPGSKRYTLNNKDYFFEPFDGFSLDDIYHALDVIAEQKDALQQWVFEHSRKVCRRDLSVSYFDCTNYYFDIGCPDVDLLDEAGNPVDKKGNPVAARYRKRGPEKNHRPDPIVEMGLLMDKNGIPVAYDLFPGNESEKVHMRPIIKRVKRDFENCRIIFVADRGLNTSDNIYYLNGDNQAEGNKKDGYVYGQSVRGADAEFKEWVLAGGYQKDTVMDEKGNPVTFIHKSRVYKKTLQVNEKIVDKKKKKKAIVVDQKQMVYYSEKYARRQRANRNAMIERAKDLIRYPKKYDRVTAKGSAAYVLNIAFSKDTGEIVDGKALGLDLAKVAEEEKYDGYYSIVTSELEMSDQELREVYRGLAKIEDSFKVTKTCFESRPVYVWLNEHIEAHFATCFLALVIERLLEAKLGNKYPAAQILESLRNYNCTREDSTTWKFTYYDEIIDACGKALNMSLNNKYLYQQQVQRLLRY